MPAIKICACCGDAHWDDRPHECKAALIEKMREAREADSKELRTITWSVKRMRQMKAALQACEAYFEERADAEYFPDSASPCGNEEMQLLAEVKQAIAGLREPVSDHVVTYLKKEDAEVVNRILDEDGQ